MHACVQGSWTLDEFEAAREDPRLQSPKLQAMVDSEFKRLRGIPQMLDPSEGDPWQSEINNSQPLTFIDLDGSPLMHHCRCS
jgi:hypothetical protein